MKQLKDIIIQKLTDTSMAGYAGLIVCYSGNEREPIATIPTPPGVNGDYIAGMYKEIYATVVPFLDNEVYHDGILHDRNYDNNTRQRFSVIEIKPTPKKHEETPSDMIPPAGPDGVRTLQTPIGVMNMQTSVSDDKIPDDSLRKQLCEAVKACKENPNCVGIYIRSAFSMRLIDQLPMLDKNSPKEDVDVVNDKLLTILVQYGLNKVIHQRMTDSIVGSSTTSFYEIFIDDFDHHYAATHPIIDDAVNQRSKVLSVLIEHYGKGVAFANCKSMSIVMKDETGKLSDYVELTF